MMRGPQLMRAILLMTMAATVGRGLAGCGDRPAEEVHHGLGLNQLKSRSQGEEQYRVAHVEVSKTRTYDVELRVEESYDQSQGPDVARRTVRERLTWQQGPPGIKPAQPDGESRTDRAVTLTVRRRAVRNATGNNTADENEPIINFVSFDINGKAQPTAVLSEGPHADAVEAMLGSPSLAGLGTSTSWLPPRAIRLGESWSIHELISAPSLNELKSRVASLGGRIEEAAFHGSARLERVERNGEETLLHVRLEALHDLGGQFVRDGHVIPLSIGVHFGARAAIRLSDGTPTTIEATVTTRQVERHPQRVAATVRSSLHVQTTPRAGAAREKHR